MLQELIRKGADKVIVEHIASGKVYIGGSAGSVILSPNIEFMKCYDDCKMACELQSFSALNVIDFYPVTHYGNFP